LPRFYRIRPGAYADKLRAATGIPGIGKGLTVVPGEIAGHGSCARRDLLLQVDVRSPRAASVTAGFRGLRSQLLEHRAGVRRFD
jgi:hypothetical protein